MLGVDICGRRLMKLGADFYFFKALFDPDT